MRSVYEIKTHKQLESEGYLVDYKTRPRMVPRGYSVDFFGLFDLVAYKRGEPLRWISVKGTMGILKSHREAIKLFVLPRGNTKEIWCYTGPGRIIREAI